MPALIAAFKDAKWELSGNIVAALKAIGPAALPILLQSLGDKEPGVRECVALAVGKIGRAAKQAVPALQALLGDPNWRVRDAARKAIPLIDPTAKLKAPPGVQTPVEEEDVF